MCVCVCVCVEYTHLLLHTNVILSFCFPVKCAAALCISTVKWPCNRKKVFTVGMDTSGHKTEGSYNLS